MAEGGHPLIIVTGGAGFIGSNILAGLETRAVHELVAVDRLGDGSPGSGEGPDKWRNLAGRTLHDLIAPEGLARFLDRHRHRIEAIVHMGAVSATTETNVDLVVASNIRLTLDLVDWCAEHGVRLIYASSAATYGDGSQGFDDDGSEQALARLRPLNPYGWSKLMVDRAVARRAALGQPLPPQIVGLRFFNVYGPNEYHKGGQQSVVSRIFPRAAAGEACTLFRSHHPDYPDGGQMRDFVWVGDCVDVVRWLLDTPAVSGLFNVGSGRARTFRDLAAATYAALDRPARITFVDTPVALRPQYQYFTEASLDRLRQAGYRAAFTSLEEGIRRYVQDHLVRPDPYL